MLLVVRGDLQSETGWSRATRALVEAVAEDFDMIVGVDLHFHPTRSRSRFPGLVVDQATAEGLIEHSRGGVVLHATLPDGIAYMSGAVNVGWWFWETDRLPSTGDWLERLDSLDAVMVPSPWQADVVRQLHLKAPIVVAPWPHAIADVAPGPAVPIAGTRLADAPVYRAMDRAHYSAMLDIDRRYHRTSEGVTDPGRLSAIKSEMFQGRRTTLSAALQDYDGYFFSVQSDAPRKGLAPLLSEWCTYRSRAATNHALVIRFSSLNVTLDRATVYQRFWEVALAASRGAPGLEHVVIVLDHLDETDLAGLYAGATAFVSATFGEGFGGTLVEAAQVGCPVIAPIHTACGQLVPDSYPGAIPSIAIVGALVGQLPIQPANGSWHAPEPGAIADRLLRSERQSPDERAGDVRQLTEHIRKCLAPSEARNAMREAVSMARAASVGLVRPLLPDLGGARA